MQSKEALGRVEVLTIGDVLMLLSPKGKFSPLCKKAPSIRTWLFYRRTDRLWLPLILGGS